MMAMIPSQQQKSIHVDVLLHLDVYIFRWKRPIIAKNLSGNEGSIEHI